MGLCTHIFWCVCLSVCFVFLSVCLLSLCLSFSHLYSSVIEIIKSNKMCLVVYDCVEQCGK